MIVHPSPVLNPSPVSATICRGAALELQANTTANVAVNWTDYNISDVASVTPQATPDIDTVYQVTATNEYGCTNTGEIEPLPLHSRSKFMRRMPKYVRAKA